MDKKEFIARQFARTDKKNYENYVLTRIWHKIDRLDLEPRTQQYIARKDGYSLADLYFHQLNIVVEVDENHDEKSLIPADEIRDSDIIEAIDPKIYRVSIKGLHTIDNINKRADDIAEIIRNEIISKIADGSFTPWDYESDHNPEKYIKAGKIRLSDNASFSKSVEVLRCFGIDLKGFQRGGKEHPKDKDTLLWFPKLNRKEAEWHNEITKDGATIFEKNTDPVKNEVHIQKCVKDPRNIRIVFASEKDNLNDTMYKFKGVFKLNTERTNNEKRAVWERISDKVATIGGLKQSDSK